MELPVSGLKVRFHLPDGNDDLAMLEAGGGPVAQSLAVLPRLAAQETDAPIDWRSLTVTDFETALLGLREFLFGDRISCVFQGTAHGCSGMLELELSVRSFLAAARPSRRRAVEPLDQPQGWFRLDAASDAPRFRLPVVEDQIQAIDRRDGAAFLARRCIDAVGCDVRARGRVERAMEAMAPTVSRELTGSCPDCGAPIAVSLHVPSLVVEELRMSSSGVHGEIDCIAGAYHWDEAAILALPQSRRRAYAAAIRRRERGDA